MPEVIYLNGRFVSREEAVISFEDRGFLFGDAVYEVVRSYGGRLFAMGRHLARLERSLREVDIQGVDVAGIGRVTEEALGRSGFAEALVYIQVTRGPAPRRHAYTGDLHPTVLIHVRDMRPLAEAGGQPPALQLVNASMCEGVAVITAPDTRWRRCDIKSTNLLPNILAQTRAKRQGAYEAVLVDEDGCVTEATSATVFCVERGVLLTRPGGPEILPSITREVVIELAQEEGIPVREERIPGERLRGAEEVFLAGTGDEVCPVVKVDGVMIGDGKPGAVTMRLLTGLRGRFGAGDRAQGTGT